MRRPASLRAPRAAALAVLSLLVACGDGGGGGATDPGGGGGGGDVPVATLVVQGAPTGPLLVDSTAQLFVTALSASGATISNARITWATSDAGLATVSAGGLVTGRGPGIVTVTAASGGQQQSSTIRVFAGATVGPAGATIQAGSLGTLAVNPSPFASSVTLLLGPAGADVAPAGAEIVPGTALSIAPAGQQFGNGAELTLAYDPAKLPPGAAEAGLQLFLRIDSRWIPIPHPAVDRANRRVRAAVSEAGIYAVGYSPVDHLAITGTATGGALFVGRTTTLAAQAYDARNVMLAGRPVTWATSDAGIATVSADGLVTGVGAGTATITATAEGKSATTTVQVLARVTADWTRAVEWSTYQGNAGHTGYVPVTVDAGAIQERWVVTPFAGGRLHPVATSPGAVYVSSTSQRLAALDPATGTARWTAASFAVDGLDAPAYGDGKVFVQTQGHGNSFLWAFDAATGDLRFRSAYGNQWSSYYAPVVVGGAVYMAGGYYGGAYSFAAADGAERWFRALNQYDAWSPAVRDGRVYAYTGSYSPEVTVMNAVTGAVEFSIPDPAFEWRGWSMDLAPALGDANNLLATNGGRLISFDLAGQRIGWQHTGGFTGSVSVGGGHVYVVANGHVEVRRESDGGLVGPWVPPTGRVEGPVLVTSNLLFASTASTTYAVDLATRRQVWSYPMGGALSLSAEGVLYIAQREGGKLAAIGLR